MGRNKETTTRSLNHLQLNQQEQEHTGTYVKFWETHPDAESEFREVMEYLRAIQPELNRILETLEEKSQIDESSRLEQSSLMNQCVSTLKGHELSVMKSQKGSKIFEKLLRLMDAVLMEFTSSFSEKTENIDPKDSDSFFDSDRIISFYKRLLGLVAEDIVALFLHMYSSHTLEILLACLPMAIQYESNLNSANNDLMKVSDLLAYCVNKLCEANGLEQVLLHPSGSHVLRSLFLTLTSYVVHDISRFQSQLKTHSISEFFSQTQACCEPQKQFKPIPEILNIFALLISATLDGISLKPLRYALNSHASAVLQLLVYLLHLNVPQSRAFKVKLVSLFLPKRESQVNNFHEAIDAMLRSSCGSRLFECLLKGCSEQHVYCFVWFYLNKNGMLHQWSLAPYGNYVIKSLFISPFLKAPEFQCLVEGLDFSSLLNARHHGIIWKCIETCNRLSCYHKVVFSKYLNALKVKKSSDFSFLWYAIILSSTPKEVQQLQSQKHDESSDIHSKAAQKSFTPDPIGCSILSAFLKFPPQCIAPLLQSAKFFAKSEREDWLFQLAKFREGSYLLQYLFNSSALPSKQKDRLARSLLSHISDLALSRIGAFVVQSAFRGSSPNVQKLIAASLESVADDLKQSNYALYQALNLKTYFNDASRWNTERTKASKIEKIFSELLVPNSTARKRNECSTKRINSEANCMPPSSCNSLPRNKERKTKHIRLKA